MIKFKTYRLLIEGVAFKDAKTLAKVLSEFHPQVSDNKLNFHLSKVDCDSVIYSLNSIVAAKDRTFTISKPIKDGSKYTFHIMFK